MYATCLRCDRPLGRNTELPHLPVGRRVAFDTTTGRLWVVCVRCGQWNLTPLEERWEALAECERLATTAEAHVSGGALGLARTRSGLELLRVGGMAAEDIANWRYARRVRTRQRLAAAVLVVFAVLTLALSIGAGAVAGTPLVAVWVAPGLAYWFYRVWQHPPRLYARVPDGTGRRYLLGPWHLDAVRVLWDADGDRDSPVVVLPHAGGEAQFRGPMAAAVLAGLLPKLNATDCTRVDVAGAVQQVADAEQDRARRDADQAGTPGGAPVSARHHGPSVTEAAQAWAEVHGLAIPGKRRHATARALSRYLALRPWERVAGRTAWRGVTLVCDLEPEDRLALEMAVTEEVEATALRARAAAAEPEWRAEDTVAAIADDLLVPAPVRERLDALRSAARSRRSTRP